MAPQSANATQKVVREVSFGRRMRGKGGEEKRLQPLSADGSEPATTQTRAAQGRPPLPRSPTVSSVSESENPRRSAMHAGAPVAQLPGVTESRTDVRSVRAVGRAPDLRRRPRQGRARTARSNLVAAGNATQAFRTSCLHIHNSTARCSAASWARAGQKAVRLQEMMEPTLRSFSHSFSPNSLRPQTGRTLMLVGCLSRREPQLWQRPCTQAAALVRTLSLSLREP